MGEGVGYRGAAAVTTTQQVMALNGNRSAFGRFGPVQSWATEDNGAATRAQGGARLLLNELPEGLMAVCNGSCNKFVTGFVTGKNGNNANK
jgi:hypothetical protein